MRLSIDAQLEYAFQAPCETLLLLEVAQVPGQAVIQDSLEITPGAGVHRLDGPSDGERRVVIAAGGDVLIRYRALVELSPRDDSLQGAVRAAVRDLPPGALRYLRGSRYCPSDRFESFVRREFPDLSGGDAVLAIVDWVGRHLDYRAGVSDSATTALDTFVDRAGVCRDFAHLTIALCRAAGIPARAVSAYAWRLDPPDLHAVVEVFVGGCWRLLDPTGKAPTEGLVRIATGRDAADIAFMTIFGQAQLIAQSFTVAEAVAGGVS